MIGSVIHSRARLAACALLLAWALGGCDFAPFAVDIPRSHDAGQGSSMMPAEAGARDAGPPDAAPPPDASEPDPRLHASCAAALPEVLPAPPPVPLDASGRPLFDLYRNVSCDDAAQQPLCDENTLCPSEFGASCVQSSASDPGICAYHDDNTGRIPFTLDEGRCVTWGVLAVHQRACCAHIPGVDCRAWPYGQAQSRTSKIGELCARHGDCEPGLLCKAFYEVGLCSCPDSDEEPDEC